MALPTCLGLWTATALGILGSALAAASADPTKSSAVSSGGEVDVGPEVDEAADQGYDGSLLLQAPSAARASGVDVDVYVHNFHRTDSQQVTEEDVYAQLNRLNMSYPGGQGGAPTRFEFRLKAYENIPVRSSRVEVTSPRADRLKDEQHERSRATLNIYLANRLTYRGDVIRGFTTPPWWLDNQPGTDGVWLQRGVMPGVPGGPSYRDNGDALVHEVGTGSGSTTCIGGACSGPGDGVDDTGRMSRASAQASTFSPTARPHAGRASGTATGPDRI